MDKKHYKTIVLSDIHLGSASSKTKEVADFLKKNTCDTLILNGDIIDFWSLKKFGKWKKKHSEFMKQIFDQLKHNTKIIYLRGNHDDLLESFIPLELGNICLVNEYILESNGKKFYVIHGDIFDIITTNATWLSVIGGVGYEFLLWLNRKYNNYRLWRGKEYYSLSKVVKNKIKYAVSYISNFEHSLVKAAKKYKCDGVICGHIHQPEISEIDGIIYMNSGDWVENLTALVEDYDGVWKIHYHVHSK